MATVTRRDSEFRKDAAREKTTACTHLKMNVQRSALAFAHSYGIELETIVNINQWLYELVYIVSI